MEWCFLSALTYRLHVPLTTGGAYIRSLLLDTYYTVDNSALVNDWYGNVFVNPPYGRDIYKFIKKAYEEIQRDSNRIIVLLITARTDTKYWHEFVQDKAVVNFLKGRLKFEINGAPVGAAPFPSAVVIYGI